MADPLQDEDWIAVAVLGRARGIRGEITAVALGKPERLAALREVWIEGRRYEVEEVWFHNGRPVLKFAGVDTMTDAQALTGSELRIPRSERGEPEPGEYFISDLIGCEVIERATGRSLGHVTGWQDWGGPGVLEVGNLMIPFARSICVAIEPEARRILVDLPEGLTELNQP